MYRTSQQIHHSLWTVTAWLPSRLGNRQHVTEDNVLWASGWKRTPRVWLAEAETASRVIMDLDSVFSIEYHLLMVKHSSSGGLVVSHRFKR